MFWDQSWRALHFWVWTLPASFLSSLSVYFLWLLSRLSGKSLTILSVSYTLLPSSTLHPYRRSSNGWSPRGPHPPLPGLALLGSSWSTFIKPQDGIWNSLHFLLLRQRSVPFVLRCVRMSWPERLLIEFGPLWLFVRFARSSWWQFQVCIVSWSCRFQ